MQIWSYNVTEFPGKHINNEYIWADLCDKTTGKNGNKFPDKIW